MEKFRCGYITIIGKPNSGKSTLLNALVGEKVSIVSPKAQTTRNNITGIVNSENYQIVIVDTPGINKAQNFLDDYMQKSVKSASVDVDAILYTIDASKKITEEDFQLLSKFQKNSIPLIIVLTKIDLIAQKDIFEKLLQFNIQKDVEVVPVSGIKNLNTDELIKVILKYLPETDKLNKFYDDSMYTDKSMKFIVSEIIREKALYLLNKEIPHGIAVEILKFEELSNIINIDANLICEKDSHKSIIIGKNGSMLKKIGHNSRVSIQKITQSKVNLQLWVKVNKNWRDKVSFLNEIGYNNSEV